MWLHIYVLRVVCVCTDEALERLKEKKKQIVSNCSNACVDSLQSRFLMYCSCVAIASLLMNRICPVLALGL